MRRFGFPLAIVVAASGCHDPVIKEVTFRVTAVPDCPTPANECQLITLDCVRKVRATLFRGASTEVLQDTGCVNVPTQGVPLSLCEPQRLFPGPLFRNVTEPLVKLSVEGFTAGGPACADSNRVFSATSPSPFNVADHAERRVPVLLTAACDTNNICVEALSLRGQLIPWPREFRGEPAVPLPSTDFEVQFGYTDRLQDMDTRYAFQRMKTADADGLFWFRADIVYSRSLLLGEKLCRGYRIQGRLSGSEITLTCADIHPGSKDTQLVDAHVVRGPIADAARMLLVENRGLLIGQARSGLGQPVSGASVSFRSVGQAYYLTDDSPPRFVSNVSSTGASGVFAVPSEGGGTEFIALDPAASVRFPGRIDPVPLRGTVIPGWMTAVYVDDR